MDLLEQYKQQYPEKFREQKPAPMTDEYGREYSTLVALVMRLSGGRIRDSKQASYALLGAAAIIAVISGILFLRLFSSGTGPNAGRITPPVTGSSNGIPR